MLGNFSDLLLAAETHPAMLLYLDNHLSVGPNSQAARAPRAAPGPSASIGINENLAREILELHTLGVGGGYTQADVTSFAEVLTGWSIGDNRGRFAAGEPGKFLFRAELHEPGAKRVLNTRYPDSGFGQGVAVLQRPGAPAARPRTSSPPSSRGTSSPTSRRRRRSARMAGAFTASEGDLPTVYRALIEAREAWAQPLAKYKTPCDYIRLRLPRPRPAGRGGPRAARALRAARAAHLVSPARPRAGRTAAPTGTAPRRS